MKGPRKKSDVGVKKRRAVSRAIEEAVVESQDEELLPAAIEETSHTPDVFVVEDTDEESSVTERGLARRDLLDTYLREISRFPMLDREKEHSLALRYLHDKDLEAAKTLVQSNLWLVVKIAKEYQDAARNLLDLIQEGNIGLMEAVKNFDPFREVRFPSYATWWIKAYIIRYLINNFRLVKVGTTQAQRKLFFNLRKERDRLEREGFFPTPKLLAQRLDVKESEVVEMEQRLLSPDASVHTPINNDGDQDLLSVLPSEDSSAEEVLAKKQLLQQLHNNFAEFETKLNDKERTIFRERLLSEEKVTLQELSDRFSISKERVRQIEERLLVKLKGFLEERMGTEVENL